MPKILLTGAGGQLGSVLIPYLREKYGIENVIATDLKPLKNASGPSDVLDVLDYEGVKSIIQKYEIDQIYHLAAILSAKGEQDPRFTWKVNMDGLLNILEISRELGIEKVFNPSSIAVFGSKTQKENTPQNPILIPETIYGMSKEAGENWTNYYYQKYGLDVRSIRYPGLIGYNSLPGGGTTDYAVEIFHDAINKGKYTCFLNSDTVLPMMYMQDAMRATVELMEAPIEDIKIRTSYNLAAMSFSPEQIFLEIKKYLPKFKIKYKADFRDEIAKSWVESVDDSAARKDWGWKETYDLPRMVKDMIYNLRIEPHSSSD